MSDEQALRAAYEELVASRPAAERRACPPAEKLLDVVERRGAEESRLATLDHVMQCVACRAELDLLRAATSAARETLPAEGEGADRGFSGRSRFPMRTLAAAAGIVFVIGVGVITLGRDDEAGPARTRGSQPTLVLAAPLRAADGSVVLRWQRWPDAAQYRVDVFDTSGAAVAAGVVRDTTYVVPASALRNDARALRYVVTAVLGDASEVTSVTAPLP